MGGITNIRDGNDLLRRCRPDDTRRQGLSRHHEPCRLPELGAAIIVEYSYSSDTDMLNWDRLLRMGARDSWVKAGEQVVLSVPAPIPFPRVQIFAQLNPYSLDQHRGKLVYCMIVQGKEGAALSKIVFKEDVELLSNQIYFESANGYSVVFTGCMRTEDSQKLTGSTIPFKRVEALDDLLSPDMTKAAFIPIWC